MSVRDETGDDGFERALEWFGELADLSDAERQRRLEQIAEPDVRAYVEEILEGDRSVDDRLERCMIAVAALRERAESQICASGYSIERFVLDRVRREARAHGHTWSPPAKLEATVRGLLHDPELSAAEQRGLREPDLRRGTDSIAALIALRTQAALATALAEARDARAVADVAPTAILVLRDEGDTVDGDLGAFVDDIRERLEESAPTSERLTVLAEAAAFTELRTRLRARRVDAPGKLAFRATDELATGAVLERAITDVEVLELGSSCQVIEDRIFGLAVAPQADAPAVDPWVGRLLHDKYRILDVIGVGGFGTVYEARDERGAGNVVAIKILKPHVAARPHLLQTFKSEARRATRLNHPNIVDWKVFDETGDGVQYFVMERLVGEELADLLEREGRLVPERAVRMLLAITEALCAAHHLGPDESILHLDLKPANIFVIPPRAGTEERIKVLDFGIGQYVGREEEELQPLNEPVRHATSDGKAETRAPHRTSLVFRGLDDLPTPIDADGRPFLRSTACTPEYASPEQCEHVLGREDIVRLDGRSDLFSLGVLAYRMLTGALPFPAGVVRTDQIRMHADEPARGIAHTGVPIPKRLARFVERCLERERERRFPDARAALEELRAVAQRPARTLAWAAGSAILMVGLALVGFARGWFGAGPPRLGLSDGDRVLSGKRLFMGPEHDSARLKLGGTLDADLDLGELVVSAPAGTPLSFTAQWRDREWIDLHAKGPEADGWSGSIEITDPRAAVAFAPLELVWIGSEAWGLKELRIDEQEVAHDPEEGLSIGPGCRELSVHLGARGHPDAAAWVDSVVARPAGWNEAQPEGELEFERGSTGVFTRGLPLTSDVGLWSLVARDRADGEKTLGTVVPLPALELELELYSGRHGPSRSFDEDAGHFVLFPGSMPRFRGLMTRGGHDSTTGAQVSWSLVASGQEPPEIEPSFLESIDFPLPLDELEAGRTYRLECTITDSEIEHGLVDTPSVTGMVEFLWLAGAEAVTAELMGQSLEREGQETYTSSRRPVLTLQRTPGPGAWESTWSIGEHVGEAPVLTSDRRRHTLELELPDGPEHDLRITHRFRSQAGIRSDPWSHSYRVVVDARPPRLAVDLGEEVVRDWRQALELSIEAGDESGVRGRRYRWSKPGATAAEPWNDIGVDGSARIPVPWDDDGPDGSYGLILEAKDAADNVSRESLTVHLARHGPTVDFLEPPDVTNDELWLSSDGWRVSATAVDPNAVDSVTVRVIGRVPNGELPLTVPLTDEGGDLWSTSLAFDHEWSGAEVELVVASTDAFGQTSEKRHEGELRLPTIPPPAAISAHRGGLELESMRLVRGNEEGPYAFMGRGSAAEDALTQLPWTSKAGRRDPFWRILFEAGAIPDFYLDEHEVSCGQFASFVEDERGFGWAGWWPAGDSPTERRRRAWLEALRDREPSLPVSGVTWAEAHAYASWAGKRLPSLVEFEYAVRGGTRYRSFAASGQAAITTASELSERLNVRLTGAERTVRARGTGGDLTPDTLIHDLCGNVREWTSTACPPVWSLPRDHAATLPELQLRPERSADWDRQPDYWCAGGAFDGRRFEFNCVRRVPRGEVDPAVGFRCALSVSDYRAARLDSDDRVAFEPEER